VKEQHVRTSRNPTTHAFRSRPTEMLDSAGYVVVDSGATSYFVPDAEVLLSPLFAAGHCFQLENAPVWAERLDRCPISTDARPTGYARDRGTLWVDRQTAELRVLDFNYTNLSELPRHTPWRSSRVSAPRGRKLGDQSMERPDAAARRGASHLERWTPTVGHDQDADCRSRDPGGGGEVTRVTRGDSLLYAATGPRVDIQIVSSDTLIGVAGTHIALEGTDYAARADAAGRISLSPVLAAAIARGS
jgi:hypothetical protein